MNFERFLEFGPWGVALALVGYLLSRLIDAGFSFSVRVGTKR